MTGFSVLSPSDTWPERFGAGGGLGAMVGSIGSDERRHRRWERQESVQRRKARIKRGIASAGQAGPLFW